MNVSSILDTVKASGIALFVVDGKLRVEAPVGKLTTELRGKISNHKAEIIEKLKSTSPALNVGCDVVVKAQHEFRRLKRRLSRVMLPGYLLWAQRNNRNLYADIVHAYNAFDAGERVECLKAGRIPWETYRRLMVRWARLNLAAIRRHRESVGKNPHFKKLPKQLLFKWLYILVDTWRKIGQNCPKCRCGMELTGKQRRFVSEYVLDQNATQAAIRAGYSRKTAGSAGQRLLKNVEISKSITDCLLKLSAKTNNTYERRVEVAEECLRLARDPGDYKGMLSANDQLIELGGYYRKSVEVKGDLTVNVPMSETKKFITAALSKIRGAGTMDTTK